MDAAPGQRDLPWVVPQIRPAPNEGHDPAPSLAVEYEDDGGLPGPLPELAPAVDGLQQVGQAAEKRVLKAAHLSR